MKALATILIFPSVLPATTVNQEHHRIDTNTILNIDAERQLFVDDYIIGNISGHAELRLHHPVIQNVAMVYDKPWEGAGSGYESIFKDGDIYRMYYKAWHRTVGPVYPDTDTLQLYCCYAESKDGIHWMKPDLELFAFQGSKANNIVMVSHFQGKEISAGEPAVFKDENPRCPADARYKALFPVYKPVRGLMAFKSRDGIHWSLLSDTPIIMDGNFDSQNVAFWDSRKNIYRAYWRFTKDGVRSIRTAVSEDFIHWHYFENVQYSDTLSREQLYTNQIKPYYRAPQIYIGFPARYTERGWSPSMRALPDSAHRAWRSNIVERYGTALTDGLLMASHDGVHFKRWNEAFLRPGIERPGTWSYGQQYISWSMVETKSSLEGAPNEISLYATEDYWTGKPASQLRRYTIRLDGFVSVQAPLSGGELLTKNFTFRGDSLELNFSTSAAGSILVEIQDVKGKPIPGFALADCEDIFGDSVNRNIIWKGGKKSKLSVLQGRTVRLRFVIKDADLYSFRFH